MGRRGGGRGGVDGIRIEKSVFLAGLLYTSLLDHSIFPLPFTHSQVPLPVQFPLPNQQRPSPTQHSPLFQNITYIHIIILFILSINITKS